MSFILRNIVRYAAQKLASNPQVRESAAKAARVVVDEAEQIARREDKARAARSTAAPGEPLPWLRLRRSRRA